MPSQPPGVRAQAYLGDHPEYYTGNCAVFAFGASDPLKLQLGIFYEFSFNGPPAFSFSRYCTLHGCFRSWSGVPTRVPDP